MNLVGNGSEKAKRQHNPSSGKAKKSTFATCPHGALKQTGTGPQTAVGEHIYGQKTCGNLHSDKNEVRWQRIRKGRTPSQPDRTQTAIGAFATRPHGTGPKRHLHTGSTAAVLSRPCFALPLRLPLRQGRGVGGFRKMKSSIGQ